MKEDSSKPSEAESAPDSIRDAIKKKLKDYHGLTIITKEYPDFLKNGACLVNLSFENDNQYKYEGWCLVAYIKGDNGSKQYDVRMLFSHDTLDQAIRNLEGFLNIDKETAIDYLRWMGGLTRLGLIEEDASIEWFTPLYSREQKEMKKHLHEHPPTKVEEGEAWIDVEWCGLRGDKLTLDRWRLFTQSTIDNNKAGTLIRNPESHEKPLQTGLPANYRRIPGKFPGSHKVSYPPDKDGWSQVDPKGEGHLIIQDINRHIVPLIDPSLVTKIQRKPSDCYKSFDLDLYEIKVEGCQEGGAVIHRLLWKAGHECILDTTSPPIHRLNKQLNLETKWGGDDEGVEQWGEYLTFFCRSICAEKGPFLVITDPKHPCLSEPGQPREKLEEIRNVIEAFKLERESSGTFQCTAIVFHADSLFRSEFRIPKSGILEMLDDELLFECDQSHLSSWLPLEMEGLEARKMTGRKLKGEGDPFDVNADLMSAGKFFKHLNKKAENEGLRQIETDSHKHVIVKGALLLKGQGISKYTIISNCRFRGPVDASHLVSDSSLLIKNCVFEQGLNLENASINGDLSITGTTILAGPEPGPEPGAGDFRLFNLKGLTAKSFKLSNCGIGTPLSAVGMRIDGDLDLIQNQIIGDADLQRTKMGGLNIYQPSSSGFPLQFGKKLILQHVTAESIVVSGAEIRGDLDLFCAFVRQYILLSGAGDKANFYPLVVTGNLTLYGAVVERNYVCLQGVDIQGAVEADYLRVGTGLFIVPEIESHPNRVGKNLTLSGARISDTVKIEKTKIGGSVKARTLKSGEVQIRGRFCPGVRGFKPEPVTIGGSLDLSEAIIDGQVNLAGVEIGGEESTGNSLNLRGAKIGGSLAVFDAYDKLYRSNQKEWEEQLKEYLSPLTSNSLTLKFDITAEPDKVNPLIIISLDEGEKKLRIRLFDKDGKNIVDRGENELLLGKVLSDLRNRLADYYRVQTINSHIDSSDLKERKELIEAVGGWKELIEAVQSALQCKEKHFPCGLHSTFSKGINLSKGTVGGDVDLSRLETEGKIDLSDADITHDIVIGEQETSAPIRENKKPHSLLMDGIRIGGGINLTGLRLQDRSEDDDDKGAVICRNANIEDELNMPVEPDSIPGRLDLECSELGGLVVCAETFNKETKQNKPDAIGVWGNFLKLVHSIGKLFFPSKNEDASEEKEGEPNKWGIVLKRASIGKLSLQIQKKEDSSNSAYPRPIDLRYAKIDWWEFCKKDKKSSDRKGKVVSDEAIDYIELLKGEPFQQRHTWRAIESALYNRGLPVEADEIHKEMRIELLTQGWEKARFRLRPLWPWYLIGGLATAFCLFLPTLKTPIIGVSCLLILFAVIARDFRKLARTWVWNSLTNAQTSPLRMLCIVGVWGLLSWYLFSIPGNIGPSGVALSATHTSVNVNSRPEEDQWNLGSGFTIALRYHIPIASFEVLNEWQPANDEPMIVWQQTEKGGGKQVQWVMAWKWFTPEIYALIVSMLHWLLIPMILILISGKWLRRSQK